MKIAIVCYPTHGGSGVVAAELGMELARRQHEVHFVSYQLPFRLDPLQPNITFHEVEVTAYPLFRYPPYTLELATRLVQVIRNHGVRLLHVHYAIPHAISALLARQMCYDCDTRIITTLHGTDITLVGDEPNYREITRYGIEQSDAVTAVSGYLANATRERLGVERAIDVVPNFVDMERYSPERRDPVLRARFAEPQERLLVHVSNFREVKRVPDVVEVFARVAEELPVRLLMVGTGPARPAAEAELERRGLGSRVSFVGPVDEVGELLACGDLMLLPSESESFGLVALESMACGVPVVATRSGGLPELVDDGVNGILAEVGEVEVMATRALELLSDPGAQREMGIEARRQVADRFPSPRIVDQYLGVYDRVSSEQARSRR